MAVDHRTMMDEVGEGGVQAARACGGRGHVGGADKTTGMRGPALR
jgi:hypothetical protein